jgi:4-amino-4-deoxy-L-arabinose transferase-like glycosyltransferase
VAAAVAVVALVALQVGLGLAYAAATPVWQNPDEPAHYNYVAYVARTGGLPALEAGDWDAALLEQVKTGQIAPTDPRVATIRYEAWQPPLYYLLAAQVLRVAPTSDVLAQVRLLRTLDVLLGGLTLLIGWLIGRELFPAHRWLALGVPLVMTGVPMFSSVSSAVSADPLANLLAASLTLLVLRGSIARRLSPATEQPRTWALTAGIVLGLGLLTKLALGVFVPLALGVAIRRGRRDAALVVGLPALLMAPWLVHQVTTYGWLDPFATSRHAQVVADQPRFPGLSLEYLQAFATTTFHSFWAQFGWMAIPAPDRVYWVWGAATLAGSLGLLRTRLDTRWWLVLMVVLLTLVAYVGYNLSYLQLQGRYLFIGLAAIGALLVRGWAAWLPPRLRGVGPLAIGMLLVALNVYALTRVLEPGFRG